MLNDSSVPPCTLDDRKGSLEDRKKQRRRGFKNTGNAVPDQPIIHLFSILSLILVSTTMYKERLTGSHAGRLRITIA